MLCKEYPPQECLLDPMLYDMVFREAIYPHAHYRMDSVIKRWIGAGLFLRTHPKWYHHTLLHLFASYTVFYGNLLQEVHFYYFYRILFTQLLVWVSVDFDPSTFFLLSSYPAVFTLSAAQAVEGSVNFTNRERSRSVQVQVQVNIGGGITLMRINMSSKSRSTTWTRLAVYNVQTS